MLNPLDPAPQTPRLSDKRHPLAAAIESLRKEGEAERRARRQQSEARHEATNSKIKSIEEATADAFKELRDKLEEVLEISQRTLLQAERTNGRVGSLEASVGTDEEKGLRGRMNRLEKSETRALQTIAVISFMVGIVVWAWGDEIRTRGFLNPSSVEVNRQVDAIIERKVQASALKPTPTPPHP